MKDKLSESGPDDVALDSGLGRRIVNETFGVVDDMVVAITDVVVTTHMYSQLNKWRSGTDEA